MVKVEIVLNKHEDNEEYCSPCLMVTEDSSEDRCPIILPESMETKMAEVITEKLKEDIENKYQTVEEVKKLVYGG